MMLLINQKNYLEMDICWYFSRCKYSWSRAIYKKSRQSHYLFI